MNPGQNVQGFIDRLGQLKTARSLFENTWQDIADLCIVGSANIKTTTFAGDNSRSANIFDITVIQAIDFLVASLHSGLTNQSMNWFDLNTKDPVLKKDPAVVTFLDKSKDYMLNLFNSSTSSFSSQNHEVLTSIVQYGHGCLLVEDLVEKGIRFCAVHISEIFIGENVYGLVDTVYRRFSMTARQMVQKWGDLVHMAVTKAYEKEPDKKFEVLHVVEPKSINAQPANKGHSFVSFYIDIENKKLITSGGYYENPYIIARFSKFAGEVYGRSPTWQTLPFVRLINKMTETILKAAQLQTQPPLLLADDGVMMPLNAKPNGVIFGGIADGVPRVQPLNVGGNLNIGVELLKGIQKAIRDSFFIDQLVFNQGPQMTATEVIQRQQESLKLLGPVLGRLQTEYLTPLISKVFSILARSDKLGEIPEPLKDNEYNIEYVGPVPLLQKASDVQKFQQFIASIAPVVQVSPQILDNFDLDIAARHIAESLSIWKDSIQDEKAVMDIREQRNQQQQMQQGMNLAEQASNISSVLNKK